MTFTESSQFFLLQSMDPRQQSMVSEPTNSSSRNIKDKLSSVTSKHFDLDNDTAMRNTNEPEKHNNHRQENTSQTAMDIDDRSSEEEEDDDDDLIASNNTNSKPQKDVCTAAAEAFDVEITEEDYESIAIMIDELMKDDPAVRIKAIRSLPIISKALGEERTRNELIPYITQMIDDDDEVLLVLIEEIYRLLTLQLIGGSSSLNNEFSYCLIPPFERLCQVEEKIIRDEATSKFGQIIHDMPYAEHHYYFDQYVLPLFKRLCHCDWHTARISGATLIDYAFSKFVSLSNEKKEVSRYKKEMLLLLSELCSDSIPIVRRSAIITLGKMVSVLSADNESDLVDVLESYLPLFKKLAGDDQDNVRVYAVETLIHFGHILSRQQVVDHLLYHIRLLALDQAWRVRYIAADHFIELCELLDHNTIRDSMINYFLRLLGDQEPEVRAVAISKIPGISRLIGCDLSIAKLIPIISKELITDSNKYARASLANIIIPFCYLLPHQIVIDHILECILKILKDEYPNVRLHVISNICNDYTSNGKHNTNAETKQFDISLLEESIIPSIMELTLDSDWRVRLGIIEKLPALAKQFGLSFFNERLFDLCLASLEDNVADIRLSAASNLLEIARTFNDNYEWTHAQLIPRLMERIHASSHYLHRLIYLLAFKYLAEGLGTTNNANDHLLQQITHFMTNDPVANVRFKACQIVQFLANNELISESLIKMIDTKLEDMIQTDDDIDVKYFATQSLEALRTTSSPSN
eukprot:166751_1